jgi:hypothetical protein
MRRVHHLPKNNQYSQSALLGSIQLCHFPNELVHAPALSGWDASIVQQDTMANINVVFSHGQVLWLLRVFINPSLSPYHFSFHMDQFSHPEDGGSMFL